MKQALLRAGNAIFFTLMLLWLYFTCYFVFQYFNIDFTALSDSLAKLSIIVVVLLTIGFGFRKKTLYLCKKLYHLIVDHKIVSLFAAFLFQTIITLTSVGLASADTTIVYTIATNSEFAQQTDYISIFPNNFSLVMWMKMNHWVFQSNTVVALAFWNIFFIDAGIALVYKLNKSFFTQAQANLSFVLLLLIIGLSPQYIYTYSDSITFFLLSLSLYFVSLIVLKNSKWVWSIMAGLAFGLANSFRPTTMLFLIAGVVVIWVVLTRKNFREIGKRFGKSLLLACVSFLFLSGGLSYSLNHQNTVNYQPNQSRMLLYFIDLGLTYSGNIHAEIPQSVLEAKGEDRNKEALKDIQNRLENYNFSSFTGHLFYKYYWITGEGMFGWFQERVLNEETRLDIPWLNKIQETAFARWIRSYVYVSGENYFLYAGAMQLVWILIAVGLVFGAIFFKRTNTFGLWMEITLFGGILFLMIFEGGRTRYMIQFLPSIATISAFGIAQVSSLITRGIRFMEDSSGKTT